MALPIEGVLSELLAHLRASGRAVLQAPPGAGKTTRVPIAILQDQIFDGKIILLEPRRLAARAAAERMAENLGEPVGKSIGFAMRGANTTRKSTRIDVVTEGVLTRMIQSDPELSGISCIIFDEFHERSLQADLGLAFCLEIRTALRPDLALIVMSATLDAEPVAQLMENAPIITSKGRSYPVEARFLDKPWARPNQRIPRLEQAFSELVRTAVSETKGSLLAFLPGEGEIRRVQTAVSDLKDIEILPLFGAMPFADQRRAIRPSDRRKLVLATSIAETSLTIEGIEVVIDAGRARRAAFDRASGLSRLITERATKAEATQRQGRAGRIAPGICYKLWTKGEDGGLPPFALPEILRADLTGLVLEMAVWGVFTPQDLPFLTPPRETDFAAAQTLLQELGALDMANRITELGRQIAAMPTHPRLARMLSQAGGDAAVLAALFEARDPLISGHGPLPVDLTLRLEALKDLRKFNSEHPHRAAKPALDRIRSEANRLTSTGPSLNLGQTAALAYPDRICLRRAGKAPRYLMSGGAGAYLNESDPLAGARMLVATDLDGDKNEARIRLAAPITEADVRELFPDQIETLKSCNWSKRNRAVQARQQTCFGALVLAEQSWPDAEKAEINRAMCEGIRQISLNCLPWDKASRFYLSRINFLCAQGEQLPDCSETALLDGLEKWLLPHLKGQKTPDALQSLNMLTIAKAMLDWDQSKRLDQLAPASVSAPTGTKMALDYSGEHPRGSIRLQELFGLTTHPTVGPKRLPILIELLSPAGRPVQTTADLPNFWKTSYADVRKDMRGRYPKHPWPEDPMQAEPTRRAKPRN